MVKCHQNMQNCHIHCCSPQGQYLIRQNKNCQSLRQETEPNYFCVLEDVINFPLVITGKDAVRTQNIQEKPYGKKEEQTAFLCIYNVASSLQHNCPKIHIRLQFLWQASAAKLFQRCCDEEKTPWAHLSICKHLCKYTCISTAYSSRTQKRTWQKHTKGIKSWWCHGRFPSNRNLCLWRTGCTI